MWPPSLLLTGSDFEEFGNSENLLFTAGIIFLGLFAVEFVIYQSLGVLFSNDKKISTPAGRRKLSRGLNEFVSMMLMSWLGYVSYVELGRFSAFTNGVGLDNVRYFSISFFIACHGIKIFTFDFANSCQLFVFSGRAQRLILFQAAYEIKNFIKSYNDSGIINRFSGLNIACSV